MQNVIDTNPGQKALRQTPLRRGLSKAVLRRRCDALWAMMSPCRLCPHDCAVDRMDGQRGICGLDDRCAVAWIGPHFGEEPPITGRRGAGTVFFAGCNLRCPFCQNIQISRPARIRPQWYRSVEELASEYLRLQEMGCHNIEWVTPTHVLPAAVEALILADEQGLVLPVVYNSGGYDSVEALEQLDGIVDLYLPDFKYGPAAQVQRLRAPADYWERASAALAEMARQVGPLQMDADGVAVTGVLVRHLVLPGDLADTPGVLRSVRAAMGEDLSLSLMAQYRPPRPGLSAPMDRVLDSAEYREALWQAQAIPLRQGYFQSLDSRDELVPDFDRSVPFGDQALGETAGPQAAAESE
ncbi:MAG: radical SAM protein [Deltaproteobacteria bacterium]|nr:radical SAM protein [Deltaproteobacteria bacterium]